MFGTTLIAVIAMRKFGLAWEASAIGTTAFVGALAHVTRTTTREFRRLEAQRLVDGLTGLPNRDRFHGDFRWLGKSSQDVAVALIDLDGFQQVNEHHGHAMGDMLLFRCSVILSELCGEEAQVYRLGGDEFALLKVGTFAPTLLESLCRKLIDELGSPVRIDQISISVGASVGMARRAPHRRIASSEMLREADIAMHVSKRTGGNRCTWFTREFDTEREQQRKLEEEMRQALATDQFRVHYQPLVDCRSRKVNAVEALIRWERPDGEIVGPDTFIPVAEQSGIIHAIGLVVLRRACLDALAWPGITLSVNLSPAQLRDPEFPVQLGHLLEETGFEPGRLELEITETCLVHDPALAERSLALIRNFGVKVVLDDFGTGYASFGFLRQFQFEKLKIDRSLVAEAGRDKGSRAMILSCVAVARAMHMGVTAEGVETCEQAALVRAAGCDQMQGWLYFTAMPASEIPAYLGQPIALDEGEADAPPCDVKVA